MRFRQSSTVIRAIGFRSFLLDDLLQLAFGDFEVLVNYSVFELAGVRQFFPGIREAALDDRLGVLAPRAHAALQLLDRRRVDEDADAVRMQAPHLLRPLPV